MVFAPQPLESEAAEPVFYVDEGRTTEVTIRFKANPVPRNDQVSANRE